LFSLFFSLDFCIFCPWICWSHARNSNNISKKKQWTW
jgi:hypothetical protein